MKISLDPNDQEFLEELHRLGPVTVQGVCDSVGVTATAVRQRLMRLQAQGLVERELVRSGRGRPHHTYRVTETGLKQLGDNYGDLAQTLWQVVRSIDEPEVREHVTGRVRDALVKRYGKVVYGESMSERLKQLRGALTDRGFDVEVDDSGLLPILRENSCPYQELADSDPGICELEQEVFEQVLGVSLTRTHCCLNGYHCCEFQPYEGDG